MRPDTVVVMEGKRPHGGWKILAFLGRGGSAEVYRAENEATGIVGALKILYRVDGKACARFRREIRLA